MCMCIGSLFQQDKMDYKSNVFTQFSDKFEVEIKDNKSTCPSLV